MDRRKLKARFFVAADGVCYKKAWPADLRRKRVVFERDKARCRYCDAPLAWMIPRFSVVDGRRPFSIDHIVPRCRGGQNNIDNLVSACEPCNMSKGAKIMTPLPINQRRKFPKCEELRAVGRRWSRIVAAKRAKERTA